MSYRAKEVKKVTEFSHRMKDLKITVGKATGSVRFFWVDDHLEVEEKLWHPLIMLKYLMIIILYLPLLAISHGAAPILGFDSFRSSSHPTARRITDKKEIEAAIANDKIFRKKEFEKHSWV
jgi:hypothetical protein